MADKKKTSGLEDVPQILSRPLWKDGMVWWGVASAIFWGVIIWFIFF